MSANSYVVEPSGEVTVWNTVVRAVEGGGAGIHEQYLPGYPKA
jgi:hypothetical protein